MVPRLGRQGRSFKGASQYYLHDKRAASALRVEHAETRNLPVDDPELGWRLMARTAMNADQLKRESGGKASGRKLEKPVWTLSLSWHPEERPERAHMVSAMDSALAVLGLSDRQAYYVIHNDEPQPHIHAVVNLVHPDTGRSTSVKFSKEKLSKWAEEYEREHGIYCGQRLENNAQRAAAKQARAQGLKAQFPRHKERDLALKAEITARYQTSDSGRAFLTAVRELGYELAHGRRIVLVGPDGTIHSLSRQVDGASAAQIRAKLSDLDLDGVDGVRGSILANRTQDRQLDEWGAFYAASQHRRDETAAMFEANYEALERDVRRKIAALDTGRRLSRAAAKELENHRRTLAGIEQRKAEARGALESRIEERRSAIADRHQQERTSLPRDPDAGQPKRLSPAAAPKDPATSQQRPTYEQRKRDYFRQLAAMEEPEQAHSEEETRTDQSATPTPAIDFQRAAEGTPGAAAPAPEKTYEAREAAYLRGLAQDLSSHDAQSERSTGPSLSEGTHEPG